ncbi:MAG: PaaI family thioesterase [Hyphomonadaceae bacterium]|nr:PaaI family thioesterase [Hyphomonadaceae bacterium]
MDWSERRYGVIPLSQASALSGIAFLRNIISGAYPDPPIGRQLTFRLVEVEQGFAVFEGETGPHLLNPLGGVHGGWALTLIDSACAVAAHTTLAPGKAHATIETKANLSRPIRADTGLVRCEGRVVTSGRTIISSEAKVMDAAGRVLAHGTSTIMVIDAPPPGA